MRFMDKSITTAILVALIFATLAHGAVEPWSVVIFELIFVAVLLMWGIKAVFDQSLDITIPRAAWPIAAFLVLGFAQSAGLSMDIEATRHAALMAVFLAIGFMAATNFCTRER